MISFAELTENVPDELLPPLDRSDDFIATNGLLSRQNDPFGRRVHWRENGYLILGGGFLPDDLIDAYCSRWIADRNRDGNYPRGYQSPTPYMWVDELKDICLYPPLVAILSDLIGEPMGLHLNLTDWVSTERNWHQDDYLNPPTVNSHYAAVWMALDDIHPDSGPFEFVPGSHRWPLLRREKVLARMRREDRDENWPRRSQDFVSAAMEAERQRRGLQCKQFIAKRGDVLVWHGRLMHRGTAPATPGMERRALIAHYSGLRHRSDMPKVAEWNASGGHYMVLREDEAARHQAEQEATQQRSDAR